MTVPAWVCDLDSYRRWAHSDAYPERGWLAFLDHEIWIDMSGEEFFTHNQVRTGYTYAIMRLLQCDERGSYCSAGMLLTNPTANLATEPDGLLYLWETMRSGRLRLTGDKTSGYMELEGTPDMTLEIVSETSQRKYKEVLRELYWRGGVTEYWPVDALNDPAQFDILVHTPTGYVPAPSDDGWVKSNVLGRAFRLVKETDPLGHPQFVVEVR